MKKKGGQREETKEKEDKRTWNSREMTNYEADACALTLVDAGQNSVGPILAFIFLHPNTEAQESSTGHPLAETLKNKPNKNTVKYQRSVILLADASLLFSFPQYFNYLLIPLGKLVS